MASTGSGDIQAPTAPNYVQSYSITTTGFALQWSGATDNIAVIGYEVFLNGISYAKTGQYVTYLTLNNLLQATNYSITIKAYDAAGNISLVSAALIVKTLGIVDTQAPSIPLNLKATNITANSFTISWAAATDNVGVTKYSIYRNNVLIASAAGNITTFDVKNLVPNNSYSMAIGASDAVNNTSKTSTALIVKTLSSAVVTNNLITFSEQGVGTKGLAPAIYNNVDAKNSNATFVGFSSSDGVISNSTFGDKTPTGDNRMATITSANATMTFTAPVNVSSLWTTSIVASKATGWTLEGSLNGIKKFTFIPNTANFAIKNWLETIIGKGIAVDKLTWLNASGVMIDDIKIEVVPVIAAKIASNSATVTPNPIQDYANITFINNVPSPTIIRLTDFNGKEYFNRKIETLSGENYFQLDGTSLPNGFYLLFISRQERNESLKILIQR
jgi:chitodextrinase